MRTATLRSASSPPPPNDLGVSRETLARLRTYAAELTRWQSALNLVAPATLPELWERHIRDALQLVALGQTGEWVDIGSGAGLPGLVLAAAFPTTTIHLVESDARKAAFLRQTSHVMNVNAAVHNRRIEDLASSLPWSIRTVTARALAPMSRLLAYAAPLLQRGAIGLFPKGKSYEAELTEARESWRFEVEAIRSETESSARILRITDFHGAR